MRAISLLSALLGLAQAAPVCAQASRRQPGRCDDAATHGEAADCYLRVAVRSRARVERAFRRDLQSAQVLEKGSPDPSLAEGLEVSQAAWRRYADAQCGFEGRTAFGGSGGDIVAAQCHDRLNAQRLAELKATDALLNRRPTRP